MSPRYVTAIHHYDMSLRDVTAVRPCIIIEARHLENASYKILFTLPWNVD
jgi:hypothetical protein